MAVLEYNGIILPYAHFQRCSLEAVRDDQSRTDKMVTKFDLQVQSIITPDALDMIAPELIGLDNEPIDIMNFIHDKLMTPRKRLSFQCNGIEFIPQPARGRALNAGGNASAIGFIDSMNGPLPQSCDMVRMDEATWLISYHVIAHYVVNYQFNALDSTKLIVTNLPGNVVMMNRWEERVDIDQSMYSTRTRRGKFMIRSDNDAGNLADEVRSQFAVLGVPPGFLRKESSYTVDPSGLGMAYSITDKEVFRMPLDGAYDAQGEYVEEATKMDGKRVASCRMRLKGAKNVSQAILAQTAAGAVLSRLYNAGASPLAKTNVLLQASFRAFLFDNVVEVAMAVMRPNTVTSITKGGSLTGNRGSREFNAIDNPFPAYAADRQPTYLDRGTAGILLQAAAFWDPALRNNGLVGGGQFAAENPVTPGARYQTPGNQPGRF